MTADTSILVDTAPRLSRHYAEPAPDKLNAFNEAMHLALRKAIDDAEADESCRALLITGAGRGFLHGPGFERPVCQTR